MEWQDISYRLQAFGARAFMALFRVLPLPAASGFGGFLARHVGPWLGAHRTAARNLALAFPEITKAEQRAILDDMWDNIGRTVAEYRHLGELMTDTARVEVVDPAGLLAKLRDDGRGALLVGMHYGNWELSTVPGFRTGLRQRMFYRAPNNPYVDAMLQAWRAPMRQDGYMPKGREGARQGVALLKKGAHIGMLVDQKQDEGIPAPFFGRDAMTTTAPAALARRLDVPVAAAQVVRLGRSTNFKIHVHEFLVAKTEDREADVIVTTKQINALFEGWVREHPALWLWAHRRWPKGEFLVTDSRKYARA